MNKENRLNNQSKGAGSNQASSRDSGKNIPSIKPIVKGTRMLANKKKYQNSDLDALPLKTAYFSKHVLIAFVNVSFAAVE